MKFVQIIPDAVVVVVPKLNPVAAVVFAPNPPNRLPPVAVAPKRPVEAEVVAVEPNWKGVAAAVVLAPNPPNPKQNVSIL